MKILGKGRFFLSAQKFFTINLQKVETFKRSAAEQIISFYHNFDILMIFRFKCDLALYFKKQLKTFLIKKAFNLLE